MADARDAYEPPRRHHYLTSWRHTMRTRWRVQAHRTFLLDLLRGRGVWR